jgi:hypothetical protein
VSASQRRRGQAGERECAAWLREHGYRDARRGVQFKGTPGSPDVAGGPAGFHIECKRTERLRLYPALDQATAEAGVVKVPVVWHRADRQPAVVIMWAADWIALVGMAEGS